jgi:NADPH:quinone reductase-like Zn-dependent oxidoreductase
LIGCLLQIAKAQGAFVASTCSTRNVEFVTKVLGADQAIDYTKEK